MLVKIIEAPRGEAPQWVRDAWIGVLLEGLTAKQHAAFSEAIGVESTGQPVGVLSKSPIPLDDLSGGDLDTDAKIAIERLRDKSPEAAKWWDENFSTEAMPLFRFNKECFEVVE